MGGTLSGPNPAFSLLCSGSQGESSASVLWGESPEALGAMSLAAYRIASLFSELWESRSKSYSFLYLYHLQHLALDQANRGGGGGRSESLTQTQLNSQLN